MTVVIMSWWVGIRGLVFVRPQLIDDLVAKLLHFRMANTAAPAAAAAVSYIPASVAWATSGIERDQKLCVLSSTEAT